MDDFSRYILSINTESLDGVMYRLFVQAYSNLNDYPDPDSNRVSLLNVLNLMRMSPVLDLSKTIRLCAGANCAELGSRYIKFALITDKVLNKRGGLCQKKVIIERSIMLSAGTFH